MAPYFLKLFLPVPGKVHAFKEGGGRGWGQHFQWMSLGEGRRKSASEKIPLMVLVHKQDCSACQVLKAQFSKSRQIFNLSRYFAMVNLESTMDDIPPEFAPDGRYVPRIMFFAPEGQLIREVHGPKMEFLFHYETDSEIAKSMTRVLDKIVDGGGGGFLD